MQNHFENWVQAYRFDAWCSLDVDYVKPKNERGIEKAFSDYSDGEKLKYTNEKMMISLLQQSVKEDIFVLLQHEGTARSIWLALINKFKGSTDMIKNKQALLKKSFYMFVAFEGETTKMTIDRYCHLVLEMGRLDIKKDDDEWVDKLADALPQNKWGTYLLILKHMRKSESMNLAKFMKKIEEHELDIQKTAIMSNLNAQQDVSYTTGEANLRQLRVRKSRLLSVLIVHLEQMNDAVELELMDIKWCLASAVRRAEKFQQITGRDEFHEMSASPIGFDKSKVTCFRCKEKGHFKRECKNKEAAGRQEKNDYYQKLIFHQIDQQPSSSHTIEVDKKKTYLVNQDDEKVAEGFSWDKYIPPGSGLVA
ncbi:putative transcription factor interactor and regulator CCHC(Zn) family [Helianthus annuus]|nr:putative transcription factor interactor and regulator CCHC(Zn) family [Helianthus annuus]KAJ0782525.1 putative transcription factor interactor and regulator CCHC(Zn) family [Helianthus annuus]